MNSNFQPIWQQLAHQMADDLLREPHATLSGIKALQKRYQSSRGTVLRALDHLEYLEIIAPAEYGKRRQVDLSKLKRIASLVDDSRNRILFLTEDRTYDLPFVMRNNYRVLHNLCENECYPLLHVDLPSNSSEVHKIISALQPRGMILNGIPESIAKVVSEMNIPSVGIGMRSARLPCFYVDYCDLLLGAFQKGWDLGHRRVVAPLVCPPKQYYDTLLQRIEAACPDGPAAFSQRYNLPVIESTAAEAYFEVVEEIFRYTPPTCLIVYDLSHYLVASSFLQREKLRVPEDVSVIVLTQDPLLDQIIPSIAHFQRYSDPMMIKVFHALTEQMKGMGSCTETALPVEWIPGNSLQALQLR